MSELMGAHFNFATLERPQDAISARDRELIDAAIAAGKVQVIPRGVSGLTDESGAWGHNAGSRMSARAARAAMARARQHVIVRLWNEGKTIPEIAKAVGRSVSMLSSQDLPGLRHLGLIGRRR